MRNVLGLPEVLPVRLVRWCRLCGAGGRGLGFCDAGHVQVDVQQLLADLERLAGDRVLNELERGRELPAVLAARRLVLARAREALLAVVHPVQVHLHRGGRRGLVACPSAAGGGAVLVEEPQLEAPRVYAPLHAAVDQLAALEAEHLGLWPELDPLLDWRHVDRRGPRHAHAHLVQGGGGWVRLVCEVGV